MLLDHGPAVVSLRPGADHVRAVLRLTDHRDLVSAVARCRWLLDLDADPVAIDAALAEDPLLRTAVAAQPGRRVPRCVDGNELALRIVLGQQVSTRAAQTLTKRLVADAGAALPDPLIEPGSTVTRTFPTAAAVAKLDPETLAMPRRRATTLIALATAMVRGDLDLSPGATADGRRRRAGAAARYRAVDDRVGGHARPGRPRCVPGDRSRRRGGRPGSWGWAAPRISSGTARAGARGAPTPHRCCGACSTTPSTGFPAGDGPGGAALSHPGARCRRIRRRGSWRAG